MKTIIAFVLVATVSCNDLVQGPQVGKKIYDENKEASPAIWKQKEELTIKSKDNEKISRIYVQDLRPDKDGEVKIIEGGVGQKNVTVELKSPTILRGFDFHIEVFAVDDYDSGFHEANPIEGAKTNETDKLEPVSTEATGTKGKEAPVSVGRMNRQIETEHVAMTSDYAETTDTATQTTEKAFVSQSTENATTDKLAIPTQTVNAYTTAKSNSAAVTTVVPETHRTKGSSATTAEAVTPNEASTTEAVLTTKKNY